MIQLPIDYRWVEIPTYRMVGSASYIHKYIYTQLRGTKRSQHKISTTSVTCQPTGSGISLLTKN